MTRRTGANDVAALAEGAARARRAESAASQDAASARRAARDGLGPVVARYIEARTGDRERLSAEQLDRLDAACNDWLAVYARRLGRECDPGVPVRTAAEAVIDTHDVVAAAELLTAIDADG